MKKILFSLSFNTFVLLSFLSFPFSVFAEPPDVTPELQTPKGWLKYNLIPGLKVPSSGIDYWTQNVIPFAIDVLLFLVFISSLIMLIFGGVMWITSRGEKEGLAKAKATVTYAIIGLVLGLASFIIVNTLGYFLGIKF